MTTLAIDIETYSPVNLQKCGVHAYASSPEFEILLFGYAFDDGPIDVIDLTREEMPEDLKDAIFDQHILKTAFNAAFERTVLLHILECQHRQNSGAAQRSWLEN